jgi:cysteine-rich repeat protein
MTRPHPRARFPFVLALVGSLGFAAPAAAKRSPIPTCDGLRLVVRDARLAAPTILAIKAGRLTLGSVCKEVRLHRKRAGDGAKIEAAWRRCDGLKGAVKLALTVDRSCGVLRGTLRVKGKKQGIAAAPSICGDGMIDVERGEACEPPGSAHCDANCVDAGESPLVCGTGSWETIQTALFVRHGCAASACHGGANAGGLDLRPQAAYAGLVNAASQASPMRRVEPGDDARSFLWWKLAKGTRGLGTDVPGAAMPNGAAPISEAELSAVSLWIRAGAPQTGVVPGLDALFGISCDVPHVPTCGDAVVDPGEDCDDGNNVDGDGCSHCALPRCGDGIVDLGEACDDGNQDDGDSCTSDCACNRNVTSTWGAIQQAIFRRHGCTDAACHGSAQGQGGLDLRPDVAYANLVDAQSSQSTMKRVDPGYREGSFLWWKLAKATRGLSDQEVPGAGMPNGLAPLSEDELEAIRLWIQDGAPEAGVVGGTANLLDTCLPPADPIKIRPPDPLPADVGVQLHAPAWDVPADGEDEVCFATYFDVSGVVPESEKVDCPAAWGGAAKKCFLYDKTVLTQDPNSHHSIIHYYRGAYDIADPKANFGPFTCHGGPMANQPCDPKGLGVPAPGGAECGPGGGCAGAVHSAIACIGYGPPDYGADVTGVGTDNSPTIGGSQQPVSSNVFPSGVYTPLPLSGVIVWNSHAFNLTSTPTTNEQWLDLYFAGPNDRAYQVDQLFDSSDIFVENVKPFRSHEFCRTHTFAKGTRLFQLSSHNHKRGKLFRIWGPGISDRCGCGFGTVVRPCPETTKIPPGDCKPEPGPPIFTSTQYSDPTVLYFDPPVALDGDADSRTYKFCSVYDNGAEDPATVKRRSTSPLPPPPYDGAFFEPYVGGPCPASTVECMSGPHEHEPCNGNNSACDSAPGLGDGVCDACPVHGGVTTEDEMFILLGLFYNVPVAP